MRSSITASPHIENTLPAAPTWSETLRKPLSTLLVLGTLAALVMLPAATADARPWVNALAIAGHLLVALAALGRVWCAIYISGRKNAELCSDGPYAISRNPLYFFSWLGLCGLMLVFRQPALVLATSVGFALLYIPVIQSEERRLLALFGSAYENYRASTPVFFPQKVHAGQADSREIRLRPLVRSLTEVFWFLAAAVIAESLHNTGMLESAHRSVVALL